MAVGKKQVAAASLRSRVEMTGVEKINRRILSRLVMYTGQGSFDSAGLCEPAALRMTVRNSHDDFRENNPQQKLGAMA